MSIPKVTQYTPAWLSKPNPGHDIFTSAPTKSTNTFADHSNGMSAASKRSAKPGSRRTIARRGAEVFVAVGREIRWADLVYMKDAWADKQTASRSNKGKGRDSEDSVPSQYEGDHAQGYRVGIEKDYELCTCANTCRLSKLLLQRTSVNSSSHHMRTTLRF